MKTKYIDKILKPFENKLMFSNGFFVFLFMMLSVNLAYSASTDDTTALTATEKYGDTIPSGEVDLFYICRKASESRWLRSHKLENGKCQTLYSKEGYLQTISSATYFKICEGVLQSVQKNLEEGGFECSLINSYTVTELD